MQTYEETLNYAIPFFIALIIIEAVAARLMGKQVNRSADTISSLSSGVTNTVKQVLGLSIAVVGYVWLVEHVALFEIKVVWLTYVIAFLAKDFAGYWIHRLEHTINFLWNRHIIHHSSEEFNLSCALRQSVSEAFSFIGVFMLPAAILGVPAEVFAVVAPLHLFAQFWYHTRIIDKMGFLEKIIVTPSHHRVHHAMNGPYLDKNFGQILIIWDKLFGTFQPELADEPPVYGVKRPVRTWNPLLINFQHFWLLLTDAWRARSWQDKVRLWFMPTGWRPPDVAEKYPIDTVDDFSGFKKYDTHPSRPLEIWSWVQLVITLLLMFLLTNQVSDLSMAEIMVFGAFLFVSIFSYTTLLDRSRFALLTEAVRLAFAFGILYWLEGDWFNLAELSDMANYLLVGYFLASAGATWYFYRTECRGGMDMAMA